MRNRLPWLIVAQAVLVLLSASQVALPNDPDTPLQEQRSASPRENKNQPPAVATSSNAAYGMRALPGAILRDQKFIWLRPFRMQRKDAPWLAVIVGATAGLIATDRRVGQSLTRSPPGAGYAFSNRAGQLGSGFVDTGVAGAFYLAGRWRQDENARLTGLQGFQAFADSFIVVEVLKVVTQRPRPAQPGGRVRIHNAEGQFFTGGYSFPSGHAAGAWAVATVVAERYRHRPWVPAIAYSLAGLGATARITDRRHFPSDVFVGSVVGYLIGRHVARQRSSESSTRRSHLCLQPYTPTGRGSALELSWQF
ncbi:MAG: phosphatase PAP2 family protein [Acidobacteriia bacterium]|nr:phosphatase PAP2 family protein [Terriglobia bacterium]